jgi:BCL2-associated athanogene 2
LENCTQCFLSTCSRDQIIALLDTIDNRVEALRKEALKLQEQRDNLSTRIDLLKNTDVLSNLNEADREEVNLQLKRINARLQASLK